MEVLINHLNRQDLSDMKVTTIGIDLAKNLFQLPGVNEFGKPVIKKQIHRDQMAEFFVTLPACLIGMEACGSAHHSTRELHRFGHTAPPYGSPVRHLWSANPVSVTSLGKTPRTTRSPTWLTRLSDNHCNWGVGLCYLYLRNVKNFCWNHKRVHSIYRELALNLRIKPRKRLVREKPESLSVS